MYLPTIESQKNYLNNLINKVKIFGDDGFRDVL